jgi:uncharacterized protein
VLGQLGNRIQHALRAFTPRDQKAVRAAATTFRQNPALDTATVITELASARRWFRRWRIGRAGVVQRCLVRPPVLAYRPHQRRGTRDWCAGRSPVGGLTMQA